MKAKVAPFIDDLRWKYMYPGKNFYIFEVIFIVGVLGVNLYLEYFYNETNLRAMIVNGKKFDLRIITTMVSVLGVQILLSVFGVIILEKMISRFKFYKKSLKIEVNFFFYNVFMILNNIMCVFYGFLIAAYYIKKTGGVKEESKYYYNFYINFQWVKNSLIIIFIPLIQRIVGDWFVKGIVLPKITRIFAKKKEEKRPIFDTNIQNPIPEVDEISKESSYEGEPVAPEQNGESISNHEFTFNFLMNDQSKPNELKEPEQMIKEEDMGDDEEDVPEIKPQLNNFSYVHKSDFTNVDRPLETKARAVSSFVGGEITKKFEGGLFKRDQFVDVSIDDEEADENNDPYNPDEYDSESDDQLSELNESKIIMKKKPTHDFGLNSSYLVQAFFFTGFYLPFTSPLLMAVIAAGVFLNYKFEVALLKNIYKKAQYVSIANVFMTLKFGFLSF